MELFSKRISSRSIIVALVLFLIAPRLIHAQDIGYWSPSADSRWTYQTSAGNVPLDRNITVAVVDLFASNADQIGHLQDQGINVLCMINVGYVQNADPDINDFRVSMIGKSVWSDDRRWVDIRNTGVRALMTARMTLAKQIGCKGVVTTDMELWYNDTGFYISYGDQLVYNRWLADQAHQLGLSIGLHNTFFQINDLVGWYDFGMTVQCLDSGDCESYIPFISAGKPVFSLEYNSMSSELDICKAGRKLSFGMIIKGFDDDTTFVDCRDRG